MPLHPSVSQSVRPSVRPAVCEQFLSDRLSVSESVSQSDSRCAVGSVGQFSIASQKFILSVAWCGTARYGYLHRVKQLLLYSAALCCDLLC